MIVNETVAATPPRSLNWFPANLEAFNRRFERRSPEAVLRWGLTTFNEDIVLATGFGPSGVVLMHMVSQIRPETAVFYLQTDLFFPETLALRDELRERFNINFVEVHSGLSLNEQAFQFGGALWQRNPDLCCRLRKVNPNAQIFVGKESVDYWRASRSKRIPCQYANRIPGPRKQFDQALSISHMDP